MKFQNRQPYDTDGVVGFSCRSWVNLGIIGRADVVEFHRESGSSWLPYPVEYKRGKSKKENWDKVQLCAQAICLEEMLCKTVPHGALFYGKERRRQKIIFDDELRNETIMTARRLHQLVKSAVTPAPVYSKLCDSCSFIDICLPRLLEKRRRVEQYLKSSLDF